MLEWVEVSGTSHWCVSKSAVGGTCLHELSVGKRGWDQVRVVGWRDGLCPYLRGEVHKCACACESRERRVSSLVNFWLCQLRGRGRDCACVLCEPCTWVRLNAAPCLRQTVWQAMSVSPLCVCVFLRHICISTADWTGKWESTSHIPQHGQTACVPWSGVQWPSRRSLECSSWRRWLLPNPLSGLLYLCLKKCLGFLFLLLYAFPKILQIYA